MSEENVERIKRQNKRKISVIIGNPPYNANQKNENENNKNREYPRIDQRIKDTYIKESTAQKTKLYDMYARFFRWSSDRIKDEGIIAFVTNRSFLDARTFDGFRKIVARDFNEVLIVDLGGDVRANPKISGTKNNVFGIQTGVAISFLVKRKEAALNVRILYARRPEMETRDDKLSFLATAKLQSLETLEIKPDAKQTWLNQADNDFDSFNPIASKEVKGLAAAKQQQAVFRTFSFGVVTNRDDWVYGEVPAVVKQRVIALIESYNNDRLRLAKIRDKKKIAEALSADLKWTRAVKRDLQNGVVFRFDGSLIIEAAYRPFSKKHIYFSPQLNEMQNLMPTFFGPTGSQKTPGIVFSDPTSQKPFMALAVNLCPDMHLVGAASGAVFLPLHTSVAKTADNITDWALDQFTTHYKKLKQAITKDAIFHYVYKF